MIQTLLLILASWLVIGSAAAYVWITWNVRADQRAADAAFDRELNDLLST